MRASWDCYFLKLAFVVSERSPDLRTQVGAVIVDSKKRIVSTGYNGTPSGFDDSFIDWFDESKYPYILHAESNAISFANADLSGCTLYSTLIPCSECTKLIVQNGIRNVIYSDHREGFEFSLDLMRKCGVVYRRIPIEGLDLEIKRSKS